jgi:hypothetical protein
MSRDIAGSAVRPEGEEGEDTQAEEDGEGDDNQRGVRIPQKMADPKLPSREDVEEHENASSIPQLVPALHSGQRPRNAS